MNPSLDTHHTGAISPTASSSEGMAAGTIPFELDDFDLGRHLRTILIPEDMADLKRSGLSDETIFQMGCMSAEGSKIGQATGTKRKGGGYSIPYFGILDQTQHVYTRWRLRETEGPRYIGGLGDDPELYIPPALENLPASELLIICEGEKKAARGVQEGLHSVGIQGVWCWADAGGRAIEKLNEDDIGPETPPLSAILGLAKAYRKVLVLGDSDVAQNPSSTSALRKLRDALKQRGIRAAFAVCPPRVSEKDGGIIIEKQGLDDWLVNSRRQCIRALPGLFLSSDLTSDDVSDTFSARELVVLSKGRIAFSLGGWRMWDGSLWKQREKDEVTTILRALAQRYKGARESLCNILSSWHEPIVAKTNNPGNLKLRAWADPLRAAVKALNEGIKKVESRRGTDDAIALFKPSVRVPDEVWDKDPNLLCVKNGIVNLDTGERLPAKMKYRMTKCTGVAYEPCAQAPRFLKFLREVQPDPLARAFLQRVIGYGAFGHSQEQKFFIFHGSGANGKSVFMTLIGEALGDYAMKAPSSLLAQQSAEKVRNDLAMLPGSRLVSVSESPANLKLDESVLKTMTGGDKISARHLYGEFFSYVPKFTLILDTNHLPEPIESNEAIWRRFVPVPWSTVIQPSRRNPHLITELREELGGILAWIIEGAISYSKVGLATPESIETGLKSFRETTDPFGTWLRECVTQGPTFRTSSSLLCAHFNTWAAAQDIFINMNGKQFSKRMRDSGFTSLKTGGRITWVGVKVDESGESPLGNIAEIASPNCGPANSDTTVLKLAKLTSNPEGRCHANAN